MKPIIVTYSNESHIIDSSDWVELLSDPESTERNPKYGIFYCSETIKGVFTNTVRYFTVHESDIKLIARPKKQTTC